ncbi:P-loop containing nucleoside triphosphate hydrolase protein, partial [Rhodotorula sp. JG-1b]
LPATDTQHDYAALLRKHKIKLTGLDLPEPVASINDLVARRTKSQQDDTSTNDAVKRIANNWRALGYKEPTGVQMAAWGTMLAGRDILACAPTGSGKTYSFILPLLVLLPPSLPPPPSSSSSAGAAFPQSSSSSPDDSDKVIRPRAVVIEPTRELSIQVLREARKLAAGPGGGDQSAPARAWKIAVLGEEGVGVPDAVDAEKDILITTPLRLVFALKSNLVSLASTQHLILDEADKLFELNFLEQTDEILAACKRSAPGGEGEVRKGMFSATMPSTVEELAKGVMAGAGAGMVRAIVGHKEAATTTIDQSLLFVNREDHKLLSLRSLITSGQFTPPVLIFVQSIQRAKELANELVFDGINADAIHADRSASERDEVVRRFAEGQVWCLICTDVMARGVDFKGVKLVINYDFPQSAMSYIHRIGRTGRAGKAGRAITFFSKADAGHLKTIVNVMRASGCSVPDWMVALPNPSQNSKKQLKQRPIGRKDISR